MCVLCSSILYSTSIIHFINILWIGSLLNRVINCNYHEVFRFSENKTHNSFSGIKLFYFYFITLFQSTHCVFCDPSIFYSKKQITSLVYFCFVVFHISYIKVRQILQICYFLVFPSTFIYIYDPVHAFKCPHMKA